MATNKKWYSQQWNESFGMSPIWETEEDVEILGRRRIRIWRCSNIAKFNLNMCVPNLEIKFEACWMKVSSNSNEGPRAKNITGPPLCEACMCKFMLPISEKADAHWLHLQMSVYTLVALVGLIRVPQMSVWCVTTSSMCCGGNQSDQVHTHSCLLEPTATLFSRTLVLLLLHKTALVSVVNPCWSGHSSRANYFQPILLVIRIVHITGNNWDDHCDYRCSWRQVLLFFESVTGGRLILLITRRQALSW